MDTEIERDSASERTQQTASTEEEALWKSKESQLRKHKREQELKLAMREKAKIIAGFIDRQRAVENENDERHQVVPNEAGETMDEEERVRKQQETLRTKLIEEGIKEQQRQRMEKWERDMTNELYLFNDMKREQLTDYKLKNPIAMSDSETALHLLDEKVASMGDMRRMLSQRIPQSELVELLSIPICHWQLSELPKKSDLIDALCFIFRKNIGPTLAVVVESKQFYCHSMLLGVASGFFKNRNSNQVLYIPSTKIPSRSFVNIYRWLLEPIRSITLFQLLELMRAAKFLAMNQLNRQCWRLVHEMLQSPGRVLAIFARSQLVCSHIEKTIISYVGRLWIPFAASSNFIHLDYRKVHRLLRLDSLAVNSEMEVFYSALVWLQVDWPARQSYAMDMMNVVRFDLMPFVFLISFNQRKDGSPPLVYLRDSGLIRKLIYDGLADIRTRSDRHVGGLGSCPRQWIYDPACPYHHGHNCNAVRYASFADFTNYLSLVQKVGYPHGIHVKRSSDEDIVCC